MSDRDLYAAVAERTGETISEIRRRGFTCAVPLWDEGERSAETAASETGCDDDPSTDAGLVVDWDALGYRSREPFMRGLTRRRRGSTRLRRVAAGVTPGW